MPGPVAVTSPSPETAATATFDDSHVARLVTSSMVTDGPLDRITRAVNCPARPTLEKMPGLNTANCTVVTLGDVGDRCSPQAGRMKGVSRLLLKFSGGSVDDIVLPFRVPQSFSETPTS